MFGLLFGNDKKNRQTFFAACMTKSKAKEKNLLAQKRLVKLMGKTFTRS